MDIVKSKIGIKCAYLRFLMYKYNFNEIIFVCTPFDSIQINKWVDNVYLNSIENKLLMIIFERTELEIVHFASRAQMYAI